MGDIDKAIVCYEENIKNEFASSHPYQRLAIIYRRKKDYVNEIISFSFGMQKSKLHKF